MGYFKLLGIDGDLLLHELATNYMLTLSRKQDVLQVAINMDWTAFGRQLQVHTKT